MTSAPFDLLRSDSASEAAVTWSYDISDLEPQVAASPTVGNVTPVGDLAGRDIQWAELGGHGGGRLEDLRQAAEIMRGRRIADGVKFNLVPSSREVFTQACQEGLVEDLFE